MISRKYLTVATAITCLVVTLFLQIGVFANQTQVTTAGDFTVDAEAYDVFYDCNRDGKVDMVDIFGCILRYGEEGDAVRTSYLSIPPAAFQPKLSTQTYEKSHTWLYGGGIFYVEVQLPQGANVTKMTMYCYDGVGDGGISLSLIRWHIKYNDSYMAYTASGYTETPGSATIIDDTIGISIVDNNGKAYELQLDIDKTSTSLLFQGVVIEYEYTP